ncbi:50S ribosomal protein L11 methyltransferase [bacterium]|nr:MAG: 50S ribosomal protein L11 methyltransferase [bacterium]
MSRWIEVAVGVETSGELAIVEAAASAYALRGTAIQSDPPMLRAWFSEDERAGVEAMSAAIVAALPQARTTATSIEDAGWSEAWREHFHAQHIGGIAIVPSWERETFADAVRAIVEIDPGQAFGTGLHPTTRGVLLALQELDLDGCTVTDVGTGSGILALAVARLGARRVHACDIDPVAVRAARENVRRNGLESRVHVARCSADLSGVPSARIVTANLTAGIALALARALRALVEPAGTLLLAGIVGAREREVLQAFEPLGFTVRARRAEGEWVGLALGVPAA